MRAEHLYRSAAVLPVTGPRLQSSKKLWIDLDNTPHVPFFAPIVQELTDRGYSLTITVRDAYQACELADLFKFEYRRVGRHYGRHRLMKIFGTCVRALQLLRVVAKEKPQIAIAHGSRALTIASALMKVPCVQILDYECAASTVFVKPTWLMMPEVIESAGNGHSKILKYPGLKEDVYAPRFAPDMSLRSRLGVDEGALMVTVRPPADEAHYHNPASDQLFEAVIDLLATTPAAKIILLPRNGRQAQSVRERWASLIETKKMLIPHQALDGLNLIWNSDIVISGGGTMNREAAALHVPVYSIFRGKIGAVDRYLSANGRLVLLETIEDVQKKVVLQRRDKSFRSKSVPEATLQAIVNHIVSIVESQPVTVSKSERRAC